MTRIKPHLDFGAYDWKYYNGVANKRDQRMGFNRHLMTEITKTKFYSSLRSQSNPPNGYARITRYEQGRNPKDVTNPDTLASITKYIVYGDAAKRLTVKHNVDKSIMYRWDYFGVASAIMMSELYQAGTYLASVRALHASKDIGLVDRMEDAVIGHWEVWTHKGKFFIDVDEFYPLEEQLGGVFRLAYNSNGSENTNSKHRNKNILVVDVGGHSTDVGAIDKGMVVDTSSLTSIRVGTLEMFEEFDKSLRDLLKHEFGSEYRGGGEINAKNLEDAIINEVYYFGKTKVDVSVIAQEVKNLVLNDLVEIVDQFGGALEYNAILLTGGGAALLGKALGNLFPRLEVIYAEPERDMMRYANVIGAGNFFTMLEKAGAL